METLTKENGTITKTFTSGLKVKAQRYWTDKGHWFRIVTSYDLRTIYIGYKSASIDRVCFKGKTSYLVAMLTRKGGHHFKESSKDEFKEAYKKALKIINS